MSQNTTLGVDRRLWVRQVDNVTLTPRKVQRVPAAVRRGEQ
jgi:hypothetical protein